MRRSANPAETLAELVALVAGEAKHYRRGGSRRSETALAAKILADVELPDLGPALQRLREMAFDRALGEPVKPPRKRSGLVIRIDRSAS